MSVKAWPTRERRGKRSLCGCGKPRSVQIQARAEIRSRVTGNEQLGSVSRTLCEDCARRVFEQIAGSVKEAAGEC